MRKRIKKQNVNLRFNMLIIIVYIVGIIFIIQLFNLQIVKGAEYRENSNTRLSRESTLEAARGDILDRSRKHISNNKHDIQPRTIQNQNRQWSIK